MKSANPPVPPDLTPDQFDELDSMLDDLRARYDETPQWEFCEGFMAALVCCRRAISPSEYLGELLAVDLNAVTEGKAQSEPAIEGSFADAAQQVRFLDLWHQRWQHVHAALAHEVKALDEEAAYHPEVMDVRGAVAALPESERSEAVEGPLPSFGQVWALGFMYAVETWPEEWAPPRDKDAAKWLDECLQGIVALTEDDTGEPTIAVFSEDGPPSVSAQRLDAFAAAVWGVYDLFDLWRNIGPRVETVRKSEGLGRNDPCHCGSGKKYKKCHGA